MGGPRGNDAPADAEAIADIYLASFAGTYDFALAQSEPEIRGSIADHVIGSRLMEQAKAQRPDGFELWTFQVDDGARRFYR